MIRHAPRGFTLIELMTASAILFIFVGLATLEITSMARASRNNARGATELLAATRFAERFRDDVRQALTAQVQREGNSVLLTLTDQTKIEYVLSTDLRLERVQVISGEIDSGPCVQTTSYQLDTTTQRRLLRARWECLAEIDPAQDLADPARPAPRTLILDTALRADVSEEPRK